MADDAQDSSERSKDLIPGAILVVLTGALAGLGYLQLGGVLGGLFGALSGVVLGVVGYVAVRAAKVHREAIGPKAPTGLQGLPPEQAISVLSAMVGNEGGSPALSSPVLEALAKIKDKAETDLEAAVVATEELREEYPRAPAVPAQLADLHRRRGQMESALKAASTAINQAVEGGMNVVAGRVYEDFKAQRDGLELSTASYERLAGVLGHRGDEDGARWARERSQA